jgi:hypothetical protein
MDSHEFFTNGKAMEDLTEPHMKALQQLSLLYNLKRLNRERIVGILPPYKGTFMIFPQEMTQYYPQIEVIGGWWFHLGVNRLNELNRAKLKRFTIFSPFETFIHEHLPHMRSLRTLNFIPLVDEEIPETSSLKIQGIISQSSITKMSITSTVDFPPFFSNALQRIVMSTSWPKIAEFVGRCGNMNVLDYLCIGVNSESVSRGIYVSPPSIQPWHPYGDLR